MRIQFQLIKADCFTEFTRAIAQRFHNVPAHRKVEAHTIFTHVQIVAER